MEELTGLDARFLYSETPRAHMHTMKVVVVDPGGRAEPLTAASLALALSERLDRMPGLRKRAVPVPRSLSHPVWVEDADLNLGDHLRWRRAPAPGDRRALAAVVAEVASTPLRRDRPLWELHVVDGLDGGRVAFVAKVHHALADGVAVSAMLDNVFGAGDGPPAEHPARPEAPPDPARLRHDALRNRSRRASRLPAVAGRTVRGALAARRVRRGAGQRLPGPFSGPRSPLNRALSADRTFAVADLPLADVLAVRSARGVTVNDVFLAVCGGALRAHLAEGGRLPRRTLVAGVPVATGSEAAGAGVAGVRLSGNHLDNLYLPLGTDVADPLERLDAIHRMAVVARRAREAMGTELFEDRAGHTPPRLYPLALRWWAASRLADRVRPPINVIASNVAGPRRPLEVDGGRVEELWSVGPLLEGIGANLTAWSYDGCLRVSVLGCARTLPDPWRLVDHVGAAFAELRAAALGPGVAHGPTAELVGAGA
jgi:WS/DGAT/MGAT family acyltransferase